jgi:TyrR family helix-turn-helix protein
VRQLENTIFRAITLTQGDAIDESDLNLAANSMTSGKQTIKPTGPNADHSAPDSWKQAQDIFEKDLLTQLYPQYSSSRKLAKRLKVSHSKIAQKLKYHKID